MARSKVGIDELRKASEKAIQMADSYDRINNHLASVATTMNDAWTSEENLFRVKMINELCRDMRELARCLKGFGEDTRIMVDSYEIVKNNKIDVSPII